MAVGLILAGSGSAVAAWTVFILTISFMIFILPYFMGVALIQRRSRQERAVRKNIPAPEVPAAG